MLSSGGVVVGRSRGRLEETVTEGEENCSGREVVAMVMVVVGICTCREEGEILQVEEGRRSGRVGEETLRVEEGRRSGKAEEEILQVEVGRCSGKVEEAISSVEVGRCSGKVEEEISPVEVGRCRALSVEEEISSGWRGGWEEAEGSGYGGVRRFTGGGGEVLVVKVRRKRISRVEVWRCSGWRAEEISRVERGDGVVVRGWEGLYWVGRGGVVVGGGGDFTRWGGRCKLSMGEGRLHGGSGEVSVVGRRRLILPGWRREV
ncbi:uncharacterized protein A4U43_C04F19290 [Asparagus officinalis]|uniref:Uncharacterized protein n=1 Tax=Asparagus officinalis TaxID=4686 RepID=A0A5P1F2P0_ASPOF|nr:uncharacterized protein A4U43_C04F19290 [Asparagus officinalis]